MRVVKSEAVVRLQRCVAIDEGRKKTKDHGDFEESCYPHNIQPIKIVGVPHYYNITCI